MNEKKDHVPISVVVLVTAVKKDFPGPDLDAMVLLEVIRNIHVY